MNPGAPDLRELYQEVIFDHNRKPRNYRPMPDANRHADGHNPLCGDQLTVYLHIEDEIVRDVSFVGQGCAISTASASLMTEAVKGRDVELATTLQQHFRAVLTGEEDPEDAPLGKLVSLAGVRQYPSRIKCALLGWHALMHAIADNDGQAVSTEEEGQP